MDCLRWQNEIENYFENTIPIVLANIVTIISVVKGCFATFNLKVKICHSFK